MIETIVLVSTASLIAAFAIVIRERRREAVRIPVRIGKPRKK